MTSIENPFPTGLLQPEWQKVTTPPLLEKNELHLWHIATDELASQKSDFFYELLPEPLKARADKLRNEKKRRAWIVAQAQMLQILADYLDNEIAELRFAYGKAGKPYLLNTTTRQPLDLRFNLTTADEVTLLGVRIYAEAEHPEDGLGVDCEALRPMPRALKLAHQILPEHLYTWIEHGSQHDLLTRFFMGWTAFEADAKEDGRGIVGADNKYMREQIFIQHFMPDSQHIGAFATTTPISTTQVRWLRY